MVGNDADLRNHLLQQFYYLALGGHSVYDLTYKRIRFTGKVKNWVKNCTIC